MIRKYLRLLHETMLVAVAILMCCSLAMAQDTAKRGTSTAEERQRFLEITRKMADSPLDPKLGPDRNWALQWLIAVPDINVDVCNAPLGDFMNAQYQYTPQIIGQLTFSTGAFIIEHPDKAKDHGVQYVAGMEGALHAYKSILKSKPDAKAKELDDLLEKQKKGTLAEFVTKSCQSNPQE